MDLPGESDPAASSRVLSPSPSELLLFGPWFKLQPERSPPSSRSASPNTSPQEPNEDQTKIRLSRRNLGLPPESGPLPPRTRQTRRTTMANQSETPAAPT
ncbi:hypothetical protein ISCGN_021223 [Ixodes scapularis]